MAASILSAALLQIVQATATSGLLISDELPLSRASTAYEWPFSVEQGALVCLSVNGLRTVIFTEKLADAGQARSVAVSVNPFTLYGTYEDKDLYAPFDSMETLIRRLAPFEAMGMKLCDKAKPLP